MRCSFPEKTEDFFADSKYRCIFAIPIGKPNAEIAQLVERNLAKVEVAGPSPVFRSKMTTTGKVVVFFVSARGAAGAAGAAGASAASAGASVGALPFLLLWPGCFGRSPDAILPLLAACGLCLCGFQAVPAGEIAKIGG